MLADLENAVEMMDIAQLFQDELERLSEDDLSYRTDWANLLLEELDETRASNEGQEKGEEIPGIYRIYDVNTGDDPAKLRIWVEDNKITQVATLESLGKHYSAIYEQMREFYGSEPQFYKFDRYWDLHLANTFDEEDDTLEIDTIAVWNFENYTAMLGSTWPGVAGRGMFIAVFLNERFEDPLSILDQSYDIYYWYDRALDADMEKGDVINFDPTGIYHDAKLFSLDAETILQRYHAQPADETIEYEFSDE